MGMQMDAAHKLVDHGIAASCAEHADHRTPSYTLLLHHMASAALHDHSGQCHPSRPSDYREPCVQLASVRSGQPLAREGSTSCPNPLEQMIPRMGAGIEWREVRPVMPILPS